MTRGWGIRARVLLLALAPAASILVILTAALTYLRLADVERSLQQRGAALARHVAKAAEFGLFSGDRAGLQSIADSAAAEPDVRSVVILDTASLVVARSGEVAGEAAGDEKNGPQPLVYLEPVTQSLLQFSDVPEPANRVSGQRLGEIRVEISQLGIQRVKRSQWLAALAIGLACLALAAALAMLTARGVVEPLRRITGSIARIASGRLEERVQIDAGGELASLAADINRMAAAMQASQSELEGRIEQATHELKAQMEAAESANQAKSRFLAAASHDLRQPLHAIELFAAALRRRARGRETRELSERLEQAIGSMDSLFNSLLDVYRLDAGVLQTRTQVFPVQELFRSLDAEFRGDAAVRGLRLRIVPSQKLAHSDPLLLRRILGNLISNALRYTRQGAVMVACRSDSAGLRLEVRDSGPGIDPAEQEHIFEEFHRLGGSQERDSKGQGLGLAIVARTAALLQTRVQVRSAPGRGAVFSIAIPSAQREAIADSGFRGSEPALRASPLAIIVIDDDTLVLQSTQAVLRDWFVNVMTARNLPEARSAVLRIREGAILVLCDMWLSDRENGIEALAALKAEFAGSLYGVIITGDARAETLGLIREAGYPILHKPVSAARLRATYTHYLSKARQQLGRRASDK